MDVYGFFGQSNKTILIEFMKDMQFCSIHLKKVSWDMWKTYQVKRKVMKTKHQS